MFKRIPPPLPAACLLCACVFAPASVPAFAADKPAPARPELKPEELAKRPDDYQPSGAPYDWTKTKAPERPWFHEYDQSIVMKMQVAERQPDGECKVYYKFDQALKLIEKLDGVTCGANKIIYLVGWQAGGNDGRAPAWDMVNPLLKGPDDKTALDGLRNLIRDAREFHTTVSLQLNMSDAFEDSPLWEQYLAKDVVAKDKDGKPKKGDMVDGAQSYRLSYAREWETGLAKKRIDALLKAIPELWECKRSPVNGIAYGHTLFLDGFRTNGVPVKDPTEGQDAYKSVFDEGPKPKVFEGISDFLGYTYDQEAAAQRKTFRYFRDWQVDVVCDQSTQGRTDPFVGLQPCAWNFKKPFKDDKSKPEVVPALYCGTKMRLIDELKVMRTTEDADESQRQWESLRAQFALKAAPAIYENWYRETHNGRKPDNWDKMYDGDKGDCFIPMPWWKGRIDDQHPVLVFTQKGYRSRTWELSPDWKYTKFVNVTRITSGGKPVKLERLQVAQRKLYMEMREGEMYVVMPE